MPRRWWLLPPQAALALVALWPLGWTDGPLFLIANLVAAVTFFATGLIVGTDPSHAGTGRALLVAGVVWSLNWLNGWQVGALPLIAALIGPLASVLAAWALLRYPRRWASAGPERAFVIAFTVLQLAAVAAVAVPRPEWNGLAPGTTWWTVWASEPVWQVLDLGIYQGGGALVAAVTTVVVVARSRRLRGLDRAAMRPVVAAFVVVCALTAVTNGGSALQVPGPLLAPVYLVESFAIVLVPLGFLAAAVRRWLALGDLPRLAGDLSAATDGPGLEATLRRALVDPTLAVLYRRDEASGWVDVSGRPVADGVRAGRCALDLRSSGGEIIGVVLGDEGLHRHRTFIEPVLRTAARVVETARVQAMVVARITETRASADRLAAVIAIERARILDDLRHGPLRHLDMAASRLAGVPSVGVAVLEQATAARAELAALATGAVPAELVVGGLRPALGRMTAAEIDVPAERFPACVESAVYFAAVESVANAVKHAGASRIRVAGAVTGGGLVVRVVDDGRGGADPTGAGLSGVRARIEAVGGRMTVAGAPGLGTTVTIAVPLSGAGSRVPADAGNRDRGQGRADPFPDPA